MRSTRRIPENDHRKAPFIERFRHVDALGQGPFPRLILKECFSENESIVQNCSLKSRSANQSNHVILA
jgi:hypothetical protein